MRPTTAARRSKNGSHVRNAVSIWSSYQHIARTWTRLSVSGPSCMPMSRTTAFISLKSSSLTPYCTSYGIQFPKNGRISEVRSQTTFASSLTKTFGFWCKADIIEKNQIFQWNFDRYYIELGRLDKPAVHLDNSCKNQPRNRALLNFI